MTQTPRLSLPYILSNQSQKEVTHNLALNALDTWVGPVIEDNGLTAPPADPLDGGLWVAANAATGAWLGEDGKIAQWIGGAWVFHTPYEGFRAWLKPAGMEIRFEGSVWRVGKVTANQVLVSGVQVLGGQQPAILNPSGGSIIDTEARSAINDILAALQAHGLISN